MVTGLDRRANSAHSGLCFSGFQAEGRNPFSGGSQAASESLAVTPSRGQLKERATPSSCVSLAHSTSDEGRTSSDVS